MKIRKVRRRIMGMALALAMTLCILPMSVEEVNADGFSRIQYAENITISTETVSYGFILDIRSKEKNYKTFTITSSNNKVAECSGPIVEVKKPGTAILTTKVTTKSGKVKKYRTKLRVVRYSNAFKSFKIGKKQLKGKFGKGRQAGFDPGKLPNGRVVIKPNKNWEVKSIKYQSAYYDEDGADLPPVKNKRISGTVKNNKMLKLKQGKYWHTTIIVTMHNKKTGLNEPYQIAYNDYFHLLNL